MIFGDKSVLAFDISMAGSNSCALALWVNGVQFGDLSLFGSRGVLIEAAVHFRKQEPLRQAPHLYSKRGDDLLLEALDALFGLCDGLEVSVFNIRQYGALVFSPNLCDSLDDCSIIVVADECKQKVIAGDSSGSFVAEIVVPRQAFERLLVELEEYILNHG